MFQAIRKVSKLTAEKAALEDQLTELKSKIHDSEIEQGNLDAERKRTEESTKHMVKMREESLALQKQKYQVEADAKTAKEVAKVKDAYQVKIEERLGTEVKRIQEMYGQILERLPNVSVRQRDSHISQS